MALSSGGLSWLVTSTPSEPHITLRGAVAGSCEIWEDPGAPRRQGSCTAGITGNQELGQSKLCLGPKEPSPGPSGPFSSLLLQAQPNAQSTSGFHK